MLQVMGPPKKRPRDFVLGPGDEVHFKRDDRSPDRSAAKRIDLECNDAVLIPPMNTNDGVMGGKSDLHSTPLQRRVVAAVPGKVRRLNRGRKSFWLQFVALDLGLIALPIHSSRVSRPF